MNKLIKIIVGVVCAEAGTKNAAEGGEKYAD